MNHADRIDALEGRLRLCHNLLANAHAAIDPDEFAELDACITAELKDCDGNCPAPHGAAALRQQGETECVMSPDLDAMCVTHGERCDWVECTGWRCPTSGKIVTRFVDPSPQGEDKCATCGEAHPGQRIFTNGKVWWHEYCDRPPGIMNPSAPVDPDALRQLIEYTEHKTTCSKWRHHQIEGSHLQPNKPCSCGLEKLINDLV